MDAISDNRVLNTQSSTHAECDLARSGHELQQSDFQYARSRGARHFKKQLSDIASVVAPVRALRMKVQLHRVLK